MVLENSERLTTKIDTPHVSIEGMLARRIKVAQFQRGGLTTSRFADKNTQATAAAIGDLLDAPGNRPPRAPGLQQEPTGLECQAPLSGGEVEEFKFVLHQNGVAEGSQEGLNLFLELAV
jgi:hypothetical protein